MARVCPDCGSSQIVEDAHYSQDQMVCADCGCIVTEGLLTTTQAEEGFLQAVRFSDSTGEYESMSRAKLRGLKRVRDLCRVLRLPSGFEDTAVSYYERAFPHPVYHSITLQKKEVVMGCCVYITCRQHGWPLTMATICSLLYAKKELFASIYLDMIQVLKLDVPTLSLQDMVKSHCKSFRLFQESPSAPAEFAEDLDKVLERTLQTVELASETWLVTGRHPIPIITAAAYLSWQSLKPSHRLSCTLARFCKLCETDLPPPAKKRQKEIEDNLLKLAAQLPWLKVVSLNKKNVLHYMGDILKHRTYLLRKILEPAEKDKLAKEAESTSSTPQEPAVTPFLPPCLTNKRKRSKEYPRGPQDLTGDEDISDSEIDQYLRTPAEIEEFEQAKTEALIQ
ncbi:transcription factor IIIB 50 kDa subunit isoform 1-T2 [Discoglossus pictus]